MSEVGESKAAQEAAEWLARLNSRAVSTEELNAFYEWRRDPGNAEAYARGEQIWHDTRSLGDDRDIAEAVREALERPRKARDRQALVGRRAVLAGGAAVMAAAGAGWLFLIRPQTFRTAVGEQLAVRLDDGSLMRLNTDSEASVRYSTRSREIEIARGQAFFEVRKDPSRPFRVGAAGINVIAVGTRFDVLRGSSGSGRVVLAEGRVQVELSQDGSERLLAAAGEALFVGSRGQAAVRRVDVEALTSWTAGRLIFRGTALDSAIAEVNRYSRKQIVLRAPDLRTLEVDGVFETGDPDAFVSAVTALFPLRAQVEDERIQLLRT
jgi:transmembrane sensor